MAVAVVEDANTRTEGFETGASTTNIGAGAGTGAFLEAIYQGVQSWGRKIGATGALRGFFALAGVYDLTTPANSVLMWKSTLVNSAAIHSLGMRARIASTTANYYEYIIHDDGSQGDNGEFQYPIKDAWIIEPINPSVVAWRDIVAGTPVLTSSNKDFATLAAVTITTQNENIIFDAMDLNSSMFITRGDSTDPDGTFQDILDADEGTLVAGRFGNYTSRSGVLFIFGKTIIGRTLGGSTANPTEFTDTLRTLVFPGGRVDAGWNEVEMDLTNASTVITLDNIAIEGRGRNNKKHYFDTELEVNGTTEVITFTDGHDFATGDLCVYSNEGGTNLSGLTTGTSYFVSRLSPTTIAAYAIGATVGRQNAFTDTTRVGLTAASAGAGENHSFRREPDTRPDIIFTGTGGTGLLDGCVLTACRQITLTSAADINNSVLTNCFNIAIGTGNMDGNTINAFILGLGEAAITASTLVGIDNNDFTMHADGGHAVEIDTAGTYGYLGNNHTGYGPGTVDTAGDHDFDFDTITDVDAAAETITIAGDPFVTGDPVFYSDEGGTDTIGLTDGNLYYVERISANTYELHESKFSADNGSNPIGLSDGSTGETHTLYSANAAIYNSSGGLVTINVSGGGDTPSVRNSSGSSTIINNNVALTLTGMRDNTEIRVYTAGTTTELDGVENAVGGTSDDRSHTFSLPASVSVDIKFAHGIAADGNVYTVPDRNSILALTWPTVTSELPITQVLDRTFDNPA